MTSMPFCSNFSMFITTGILYGFLCAPVASLLSVVLVEIATLEKLNNLFGIVAFIQGVGTIAGPPTAGLLIDQLYHDNGINVCYVSGGLLMVLAGIFGILTKCLPVNDKNNQFL